MSTPPTPDVRNRLTRQQVFDEVCKIVAEQSEMPAERMTEKHHLLNDLGCDSLDVIEIAMEIEEQFDISIPDDQAEKAETIGLIVDEVFKLLGKTTDE